jgi:diacylglycerol O-acyltransferase
LRQYGIGPLPGVAMMVVLISRAGYCTISTRYDRASIDDSDLWARCLVAGFDEVLALGGDGRAVPATFTVETPEPTPVSPNGSAAQ